MIKFYVDNILQSFRDSARIDIIKMDWFGIYDKRTLAGFGTNPNVAAVLIIGNGCEELSTEEIAKEIAPTGKRVESLVIQDAGGTRNHSPREEAGERDASGCGKTGSGADSLG